MSAFAATREIPAPPDEIFEFLADGRRHAEWIDKGERGPLREVVTIVHVSGPEVGEGATYRLRQTMGRFEGEDHRFRTEVYEPTHRLAFRAEGGAYDVLFDLEETSAGTQVTLTRDYGERPRRLLGRLISRFALKPKYAQPGIEDDLLGIERALGSATTKSSDGTA